MRRTDGHTDRQTETQVHVLSCAFAAKNHIVLSTKPETCPYQVTNFGFDFELGLEFGLVNNKGVSGTNKEIY